MSRSKSTAADRAGANRQIRRIRFTAAANSIKALLALTFVCTLSAQPGAVSGRVSSLLTGSPVRKAQVLLNPGNRTAVTDTDGRYKIAGVPPGRYRLSVERPGFLPVVYGAHGPNRPGKTLVVVAGEARNNIDFALEPPAVITGHLYDQDGEPLPAGVRIWRETYRDGHRTVDAAGGATADDEGQYRVYGIPAGRYYVASAQTPTGAGLEHLREVYPQTFYPGTEELSSAVAVTVAPGGEARGIDFHLRKTAAVTVAIQIEGTVVPNQNVTVVMRGRDRSTEFRGNTNGAEFRVARVTPGAYRVDATSLVADKPFYAHADADVGTLDVENVRLSLLPALEVSGVLRTDAEPGAIFVALSNPSAATPRVSARPLPDGSFTWTNLEPGKWAVSLTPLPAALYLKSAREIAITADPQKPVEIVLSSDGAQVEGTVLNPDPVEGATILLAAVDGVVKTAVTEFDGKYLLRGIPPGTYRLLAVENLESLSWNDPRVLQQFEGKGIALELTARQKATQVLTPVP